MTNDELDAVRARAEAATPGPWKACGAIYEHMNSEIRSGAKGEGRGLALVWDHDNAFRDATFIAHARTDVPALLDEVAWEKARRQSAEAHAERLAGALESVLEIATADEPMDNTEVSCRLNDDDQLNGSEGIVWVGHLERK